MRERLVPAAQYLTYSEAVDLYQQLTQTGISALVKSCGPPTLPFGEGLYFQVQVQEKDVPSAQPLLEAFSQNQAEKPHEAPKCQACGAAEIEPQRNLSWWKKVLYAGTTVYQCQGCRHTFFA
ncbi:hypothetical protein ACD591_17410 [Rufibacter glacialis]|uniref:DUF2007 domain-containing protein n=1 Tax=Rufibacter glacialis TaxID=1259555 RepID=A0A5M8QHG1_9BACT|nr:hypothetical protein [Rufibacter glacialis]KAA6434360.1 hypothetical protein FOE74_09145 [Rufibacter glacialis]GGK68840.1 hypothetical protein GCM10011405_16220 [Rufibacter glacialis]